MDKVTEALADYINDLKKQIEEDKKFEKYLLDKLGKGEIENLDLKNQIAELRQQYCQPTASGTAILEGYAVVRGEGSE